MRCRERKFDEGAFVVDPGDRLVATLAIRGAARYLGADRIGAGVDGRNADRCDASSVCASVVPSAEAMAKRTAGSASFVHAAASAASIVAAVRGGKAHFGRRIAGEQRREHIRIGGQLGDPRDTPRGIGIEMGLGTEKAFGDHVADVRRARIAHPRWYGERAKKRPGLPLRVDRVAPAFRPGLSNARLRTHQAHAVIFPA